MENISDGEYEVVVAAAAYAITTVGEQEDSLTQNKPANGSTNSQARNKSKIEEKTSKSWSFKWLSGKESKKDGKDTTGSNFQEFEDTWQKSVQVERGTTGNYSSKYNDSGKEIEDAPAFKKMPPPIEKYPNEKSIKGLQNGKDAMNGSKAKLSTEFSGPSSGYEKGRIETEADTWEKEQMLKAKNRYENMMSVISEWQIEKKTKAKSRMERKQRGPEHKRAKALQAYNNEISRTDKIVGEAKALAKERRQNDELKIREKTEKIRSTGRMPHAWGCC